MYIIDLSEDINDSINSFKKYVEIEKQKSYPLQQKLFKIFLYLTHTFNIERNEYEYFFTEKHLKDCDEDKFIDMFDIHRDSKYFKPKKIIIFKEKILFFFPTFLEIIKNFEKGELSSFFSEKLMVFLEIDDDLKFQDFEKHFSIMTDLFYNFLLSQEKDSNINYLTIFTSLTMFLIITIERVLKEILKVPELDKTSKMKNLLENKDLPLKLDNDLIIFMQYILIDVEDIDKKRKGLNLRNKVCHGNVKISQEELNSLLFIFISLMNQISIPKKNA